MRRPRRLLQFYNATYENIFATYGLFIVAAIALGIVALFFPQSSDTNVFFDVETVAINNTACPNGGQQVTVCKVAEESLLCNSTGSEILDVFSVCNGDNGTSIGITCDPIAFNSTTCEFGGYYFEFCYDIEQTGSCSTPGNIFISNKTLCNGGSGATGPTGPKGDGIGFNCTIIEPVLNSTSCTNGGQQIVMCTDVNDDGKCTEGVDTNIMTKDICNGAEGPVGPMGTSIGIDTQDLPVNSTECPYGGFGIQICIDANDDGNCTAMVDTILVNTTICTGQAPPATIFGTNYNYANETGPVMITTTSYMKSLEMTTDYLVGGYYYVQVTWEMRVGSKDSFTQVCIDGTTADCSDGFIMIGPNINHFENNERHLNSGFTQYYFTEGVHNIYFAHKKDLGIGMDPLAYSQRIVLWRVF